MVEAARRILESEGPAALSLRAVAREAGVSPAAPYHHFKDKTELVEAVAQGGWAVLTEAILEARRSGDNPAEALMQIGLAYVNFARDNPALYRVMYDQVRNRTAMAEDHKDPSSGFGQVQRALVEAGADPDDGRELELATVASWCAVHGLAEMCNFRDFEPLRQSMGDQAFLRGVLRHYGVFAADRATSHEPEGGGGATASKAAG
ncbi:MAG: TetR/AcrR family transcriptional regulator [Caulobacteraceae bacterium]